MSFVTCPACGGQIAVQAGVNLYQCPNCKHVSTMHQLAPQQLKVQPQPYKFQGLQVGENILFVAQYTPGDSHIGESIKCILLSFLGWVIALPIFALFAFIYRPFGLVAVGMALYVVWQIVWCIWMYLNFKPAILNQDLVVTDRRVVMRTSKSLLEWERFSRSFKSKNIDIPLSDYVSASVEDFDDEFKCGTVIVRTSQGISSRVFCVRDPYAAVKRMDEIVRMGA